MGKKKHRKQCRKNIVEKTQKNSVEKAASKTVSTLEKVLLYYYIVTGQDHVSFSEALAFCIFNQSKNTAIQRYIVIG